MFKDPDLAWQMRRAKGKLNELLDVSRFLWDMGLLKVVVLMAVWHAGELAYLRSQHLVAPMATHHAVAVVDVAQGLPVSLANLPPGHYRVEMSVDHRTILVFALVPGGGRDIPILVDDGDARVGHTPGAMFRI